MYQEIPLSNVRAQGWVRNYLQTQANGMTGCLDRLGEPFSGTYWGESDPGAVAETSRFLGGLNSKNDAWVPYEQTGYWIDGMVRVGHLIDDGKLLEKVKPMIDNPIRFADEDGYIGPAFLKDGMVWAHSVYFRSLMAQYAATGDRKILEAMKKHFLRVPLKDVYRKRDDWRGITVRDVCDVEAALWIYGETGDKRFLNMAEDTYREFNRLFEHDRGTAPHCKTRALTIKGMLSDDKADNNHGVTYCEICKLAAILHMYTGNPVYRNAAVKAFEKVYRDNMIVDGVISSSEYLNGNAHSRAVHETCDVADFTWAVGYLFMITGDAKYGDWVEDAVFNGGLGSVDDEFLSNQYFSCPNQVIADDHSNHADFYKGEAWMSFAPAEIMGCCTGNVNRFMPNYVIRSWMKRNEELCAFLYAPTVIRAEINGVSVEVRETTNYPFENTVEFLLIPDKEVKFTLSGRIPGWARDCRVQLNETNLPVVPVNGFFSITRDFRPGDVVRVCFEDEIRYIPNAGGVSIKKGALLYALPVKENVVMCEEKRGAGDPVFPHYALYPAGKWNYGLDMEETPRFIPSDSVGETPWKHTANKSIIVVKGYELPEWKIEETNLVRRKLHPRKRGKVIKEHCVFTPALPSRITGVKQGQELKLVPYCTTRLRIAIFPIVKGE